jgi:cation diffusion facilitator family transporter
MNRKERVAAVSVIASGSLAAAKFVVGVAIGSLALISDALHSLIDFGATVVTWIAVRAADRPPDAEHQYGHGKIESVAALAVTALLFLLAGGVAVEAVGRIQAGGTPVTFSYIPFVVLGIEMAINAWRARVLYKTARETRSEALEADSLHFASDFYGSIPVVIGLVLAAYGHYWADAVAAITVAVLISVLAFRLAKRTIDSLVDTAPPGFSAKVDATVRQIAGVVEVERMRMRSVGPRHFVDIAIQVPRTLPLDRVVNVKKTVEDAVAAVVGEADITVTAMPVALDSETVLERVMVIARNLALPVHHVTVQGIAGRLSISLDLEVDGELASGQAHEIASVLETAVRNELGPDVEVETHIEPLQPSPIAGHDADARRTEEVGAALAEIAVALGTIRDVHDVRVRDTSQGEIVNFHCHADPSLTVDTVHEKVDDVERALRRRWPQIKRVIGHAEPRPSRLQSSTGAEGDASEPAAALK